MEKKHLEQLLNRALEEYEELQDSIERALKILNEILDYNLADNTNAIEDVIRILKGDE